MKAVELQVNGAHVETSQRSLVHHRFQQANQGLPWANGEGRGHQGRGDQSLNLHKAICQGEHHPRDQVVRHANESEGLSGSRGRLLGIEEPTKDFGDSHDEANLESQSLEREGPGQPIVQKLM
jgi:hypothetical protein